MFGRQTNPRRLTRSTALALALLCLAGQAFTLLHLVLVRHVTCPEHGELIHPSELRRGEAADRYQPGATAIDVAAAPTAHRHDHCPATSLRRERAAVARPGHSIRADGACAAAVPTRHDIPPATQVSLLLLAPKSSPPA